MSRISRKILFVVGVLILSMAVIILITTITMSKVHNDNIMSERATAGINVLKNDMGIQINRLVEIAERQDVFPLPSWLRQARPLSLLLHGTAQKARTATMPQCWTQAERFSGNRKTAP